MTYELNNLDEIINKGLGPGYPETYISPHTRLKYILINLTIPMPKFPHPLYDLGYNLKKGCGIEVDIKLNGNGVSPDVLLVNDEDNHIIVFECKSKTINKSQLSKYLKLKENICNIIPKVPIPVINSPDTYILDVSYISFEDLKNHPILKDVIDIQILKVSLKERKITLEKGKYSNNKLNKEFPIIWSKKEKPSYDILLYDPNDDNSLFKMHVLKELVSLALCGHELPEIGMIFNKDIIIPKGEYTIDNDEDFNFVVSILKKKKSTFKVDTETRKIIIDNEIVILHKEKPLDKETLKLINILNIEIDMNCLVKKEFTTGMIMDRMYRRSNLHIIDYFYKNYKNKIRDEIRNSLRYKKPFKDFIECIDSKRGRWRIKVIKDKRKAKKLKEEFKTEIFKTFREGPLDSWVCQK